MALNVDLKNPGVQKTVLSVLLSGTFLGVFFCTHLLPFNYPNQSERIRQLKSDYDAKSTELARARATVADLPRFEAEYAHLHERWAHAAELLPEDRQLPLLLRRMTLAAQQNGVQFLAFKPAAAKPEQHYVELPLELSVTGTYHQVGSFLADLANMGRIVNVANLKLSTNNRQDESATTQAEFTASAYSLETGSAPAAPAPAATTPKEEGEGHARKES